MIFKKKLYKENEFVVSGEGNPEMILLLINEKEILYIPEYSKEYFFTQDTEVYEIVMDKERTILTKPENMASPFNLTGDACFYNFMARKIKISGEQEFFNKKGKDLLWLISGELNFEIIGRKKEKFGNAPLIFEEEGGTFKITGQGEMFLLNL